MNTSPIKLAYADDHAAMRQGLCTLLELTGNFKVLFQSANGAEMIDWLSRTTELPDICIIDIAMPVMDGYELLASIRKRWPLMRTLIFSMFMDDYAVRNLIKRGANGLLGKDSTADELAAALSAMHEFGYHYSGIAGNELFKMIRNKKLKPASLNPTEMQYLQLAATDMDNRDIAEKMGIAFTTLVGVRDRLFQKMRVSSRTAMVLCAVHNGLIPIT